MLLPLNCRRGLRSNIIADPVDPRNLVDNADRDLIQHVIGDASPVCCHKVGGGHGTQGQGVVVGPAVAHNADAAGVGQNGKILVQVPILTGLGDLIPEDVVSQTQSIGFLLGDRSR